MKKGNLDPNKRLLKPELEAVVVQNSVESVA